MVIKMQNSFYLDILIFGVIVIFLIFRLKSILGTKPILRKQHKQKNQDKQFTNLVS